MTAIHTSSLKRVRAYSNEILKIMFNGELIWPMGEPIVKNDPYICFSAENTQAFYIIGNFNYYNIPDPNVYYSYDKQNWTLLTYYKASNGMRTRNINFGGTYGSVYLRGKNELGFHPQFNHDLYLHEPSAQRYHFLFTNSNSVLLSGCLRALYDWENVDSDPTVNFTKKGGGFSSLFSGCTQITDASELTIYADGDYFFVSMFSGCTNLQKGPKLPSTILNEYAIYSYMFQNCSSLTQAPLLPATTLGKNCYRSMFEACSSLTQTPLLPSTNLAEMCYYAMFDGTNVIPDCTNIDFSSETVVASRGLEGLFYGTKITYDELSSILPKDSNNKPCLPVVNLAQSCYRGMFEACSLLTQAPLLPATNLAQSCYSEMFYKCSSLTQAPSILPATTLAQNCYFYMFSACSLLTQAPELPATTLVDGCYGRMFENSSNLNYIKMMAIELPSGKTYTYMTNWVKGVASSGTFVLNAAATWPSFNIGVSGRPSGWTVQTATS